METLSEDMSNDPMPLILVSAYDIASAHTLITEITKNAINDTKETPNESQIIKWHIANKYYEVDVELLPVADNDTLPLSIADRLEAHIIYIKDDEKDEVAVQRAEERCTRAGVAGKATVRLLVIAGASVASTLSAWARRRRYEPVALNEAPDEDDDEDYPDTYGADRIRDTLHAHTWRGLQRIDKPSKTVSHMNHRPFEPNGVTSSDEEYVGAETSGGEDEDVGDEESVEKAEAFAEMLGAIGEAREALRQMPAVESRRHAEHLMRAMCHALGLDMTEL